MPTARPNSPNWLSDRYNPLNAKRNFSRSWFFLRLRLVILIKLAIAFTFTPFCNHNRPRMPLSTPDFARYELKHHLMTAYSRIYSGYLSISWLNVLLFTVEITLASYYFSHFKTERVLQLLLFSIIFLDTICTITVLASSWMVIFFFSKNMVFKGLTYFYLCSY